MNLLKSHKKILIFAFVLALILFIASAFLFKRFVGDLRPSLLPAKKDLVKLLEKQSVGENVALPLVFPKDYKIGVFAKDLGTARDLQFVDDQTLLVSIPQSGKVVALVDSDQNGVAETVKDVITNLDYPHGLAFFKDKLYVAQLTKLSRYSWNSKTLTATKEKDLLTLPSSSGHVTRTIAITPEGKMYVSIGSTCNVCVEKDSFLASVIVSNTNGENPKVFAKGLRNSVFIKINPTTGELWGTENSRDLLGDNIPPDEINILKEGQNYGWPYCWGDKNHDDSFDPDNKFSCQTTLAPAFKIQAHSAPLGLNFINSAQFPESWQGDLLVSYHGSWNRSVPTGYKIVHLKVDNGKIVSQEDFLTGFLQGSSALGRPVDLEFDSKGSLYISDDKAGAVYKLVKS